MIATIFQKIFRRDPDPNVNNALRKILGAINIRTTVYISGLVLMTLLAFGISVLGFFVADDMWQVNYADDVINNGRLELIWRNFTSNYLQLPSFGFYRPLLGFTFLSDFVLYRIWAPGYHLTSIMLYIASVILLFYLIRRLTRTWPDKNSQSASYFGAALFAVSPLHCEDVCWISGRADLLCAPFYLLSLWCVVKSHQDGKKKFYWLALLFFLLAMFSKEIGIGLPLVVAAYYFIWPKEDQFFQPEEMPQYGKTNYQKEKYNRQKAHYERVLAKRIKKKKKREKKKEQEEVKSIEKEAEPVDDDVVDEEEIPFTDRFLFAFKMSLPFVLLGLVYLGIRYLALGTVIGGYGGMIGGALNQYFYLRLVELTHLGRIMIPIPEVVNEQTIVPGWTLKICLALSLIVVMFRLYAQSNPKKWLLFIFIWIVSASLPLLKLWGLGRELETSRLLFFFTMGYSALWPILMFHPTRKNPSFKLPLKADLSLGVVSAAILSCMILALAWASLQTSFLWYAAGHEMRSVWRESVRLAENTPDGKRFIVLGIPKDYHGAHLSFNGSTFYHMMRPPFIDKDLTSKVITFDPYIVGPYEVINATRFKIYLGDPNVGGPYLWNRQTNKFDKLEFKGDVTLPDRLNLPIVRSIDEPDKPVWKYQGGGAASVKEDGVMTIKDTRVGDGLIISGLNVPPLKYDFIEMDVRIDKQKDEVRGLLPFGVSWNHASTDSRRPDWVLVGLKLDKFNKFQHLRLRPSHFWRWYTRGAIETLVLRLPENTTIDIKNISLVSGKNDIPYLVPIDYKPLNSGEFVVPEKDIPIRIAYDATMVKGASKVAVEISKPNFFFDNYLMSRHETDIAHRLSVNLTKGVVSLSAKYFLRPAYYQIRIKAEDASGKTLGVTSDPVTILKLGGGLETYIN